MDTANYVCIYKHDKTKFENPFIKTCDLLRENNSEYIKKTVRQFVRMVNDGEFDFNKHQAVYIECGDLGFNLDAIDRRIKEINEIQ